MTKSVPKITCFFKGDLLTRVGKTFTGLILVKSSNSLLNCSNPCSGRTLALGLESYFKVPIVPNRIASESLQSLVVTSGKGFPYCSMATPPITPSVKLKWWLKVSSTACRHFLDWANISGPIPSPRKRAILRSILGYAFYFYTTCNNDFMYVPVQDLLLFIRKIKEFLIYCIKLYFGKFITYVLCPICQGRPAAPCGEYYGGFVDPYVRGIHNFIGLPVFNDPVLVDAGTMGKGIGAHYGLVGLYKDSHFLGYHLTGIV